jgi:alpha-maltose-1-phosphate synthase
MHSSPVRIMHISSEYPPYLTGGIGTHVYQLVQGLDTTRYEVDVFAYNPVLNSTVRDKNVTAHYLSQGNKIENLSRPLDSKEVNHLNDYLIQYASAYFSQCRPPDLIHCHDWYAFSAAKALRLTFQSPIVTTIHFLYGSSERWKDQSRIRGYEELESDTCKKSDAIIAVSQFLKRDIERIKGVDSNCVHVVYNGVDTAEIAGSQVNAPDIEAIRREYAPNGEKIVLFAGRVSYLKGVSALLMSAARVLERVGAAVYLIAGEYLPGEYTDIVFSLAHNHPRLKGRVKFLGKLSRKHLFQLYHAASIVVVPSTYETFGYVAAEAMAAGTPVIASNTGGLSELIEHRKSGLLIPMNKDNNGYSGIDIVKLADAQVELMQDEFLRARMGLAGQQLVTSKFTLQRMVNETADIYASLMKGRQLPA